MSIKIMAHVWDHSRHQNAALLLMLAIADYADQDGWAWPSIATLAGRARISPRNTKRVLQQMIQEPTPELEIRRGKGPHGCNLYRILLPLQGGGDNLSPPCTDEQAIGGDNWGLGGDIAMSPDPSVDPSEEHTQTAHAREDDGLPGQIPVKQPSNKPEDETPCVCEDASMADEPEAQPEPEPMPQPEPQAALLTPCPYDPAFPCEHQQDIAEAIAPMVGNYVRVKAGDVPAEVAHAWTVPEVTLLYDWLTQVKAPDDPAWWRLRNAFSPTHRDDNLCMARQWAAKRDAKRSAAVCPHPPNRIGYNPMLAQYHCFGCFQDVPVEVASALGCDEHLDREEQCDVE